MKKALRSVLFLLFIFLLYISCTESKEETTMRITISEATRSIVPSNYSLSISQYVIKGKGPGGTSFETTTSKTSVSIDGLRVGTWALSAEALNEEGDVIVKGTTSFNLTQDNRGATIELDTLIGEGDLSVTLTWDTSYLSQTPTLSVSLIDQYSGDVIDENDNFSASNLKQGKVSFSGTYDSGQYVLVAKLYEKTDLKGTIVEAVRISADQTSKETVDFALESYSSDEEGVEIENSSGAFVTLTINGVPSTVTVGEDIEAYIYASNDNVSAFSVSWYLDGDVIGTGSDITFSAEEGKHTLSALIASSKVGDLANTKAVFEVIAEDVEGSPYSTTVFSSSSTSINLGRNSYIRFMNDGRAIVVSNTERTIQIVSFSDNNAIVDKTFSYSSLGISGNISAFDIMNYSSSLVKVFIAEDSPFTFYSFNFNVSSSTLTLSDTVSGDFAIYSAGGGKNDTASRALHAMFSEERKILLVAVVDINESYYQYLGFNYGNSTSPFSSSNLRNYTLAWGFCETEPPVVYDINSAGMLAASNDGNICGLSNWSSSTSIYRTVTGFNSEAPNMTTPMGICWLGENDVYLQSLNTDYIFTFRITLAGTLLSSTTSDGHLKAGLTSNADYSFAYYIDLDTNELVTMQITSDGMSISEIKRTTLKTNAPSSLNISPDGKYIIVYNGTSENNFEFIKIRRG